MISLNSVHIDLGMVQTLVYNECDFKLSKLQRNLESINYGACSYNLNGHSIEHRVSRITPLKTGQFVAIWKRNKKGFTEPFSITDSLEFMMITSRSGSDFGQFVFPKRVLAHKGIISGNGNIGKRGMRVYPPWDHTTSKQAEETQCWQIKYFLPISLNKPINLNFAKELFSDIKEINII